MLKKLKKVPGLNKLEGFAKKHIGSRDYKAASDMMRKILVNTVKKTLMVGKGAGTSVVSGTKKVAVKTKKVVASTAGKIKTTTMGKRTSKVSNKK